MSKVYKDGVLLWKQGLGKTIFDVSWMVAIVFGAALLIYSIDGCAGHQAGVPETQAEVYLKARMTFNGLLSDYIAQKLAAPNATRAKWSEKIDPWFERGAVALKAWGTALAAGDGSAYDQQSAYLELKNQLLQVLLQELTKEDN